MKLAILVVFIISLAVVNPFSVPLFLVFLVAAHFLNKKAKGKVHNPVMWLFYTALVFCIVSLVWAAIRGGPNSDARMGNYLFSYGLVALGAWAYSSSWLSTYGHRAAKVLENSLAENDNTST
jgi:hypothetical protein